MGVHFLSVDKNTAKKFIDTNEVTLNIDRRNQLYKEGDLVFLGKIGTQNSRLRGVINSISLYNKNRKTVTIGKRGA